MTNPSYVAIRIDCDEDFGDVFFAMPYHADFDNLYHDLVSAVSNAGLRAHRVDKTPQDANWLAQIYKRIKSSSVVVAICTPQSDQTVPNGNVMYELGLAHAWGKTTLILCKDRKQVPSDLFPFVMEEYGVYDVDEKQTKSFIRQIENSILHLARTKDQPTENIFFFDNVPPIFVEKEMATNVTGIFDFAGEIAIKMKHLAPYVKYFDELISRMSVTKPILEKENMSFMLDSLWNYIKQDLGPSLFVSDVYGSSANFVVKKEPSVRGSLSYLHGRYGDIFPGNCIAYFDNIIGNLRKMPATFEPLGKIKETVFSSEPLSFISELNAQIATLRGIGTTVEQNCSLLTSSLLHWVHKR